MATADKKQDWSNGKICIIDEAHIFVVFIEVIIKSKKHPETTKR